MNALSDLTTAHWRIETDADELIWLCLDKADASANVLSAEVLGEFEAILTAIEKQPSVRGLIIYSGKSSGFVMGADINEFTTIGTADEAFELIRQGQQLFDRLEQLNCPSVAVFNGFALGGGLELALACTYRIALAGNKSTIGLPEVQLGLHPGFGGTVRAVRTAGVRAAMPVMLTGKPMRVDKALGLGFIDSVVTPDSWKQAAREIVVSGRPRRAAPLLDRILNLAPVRPLVCRMLLKQVSTRARRDHYPAPYAIIDLWRRHGASASSYEAEARSFANLMMGSTSRNLVRIFFLQNRLKNPGGKSGDAISRVHVIGAGVMGGDIAAWCALRGLDVTLQDRAVEYIEPAMKRAARLFSKRIRDANERAAATDRLVPDVEGKGIATADLIIEAIFEDLAAKQALYRDVQVSMKAGAILASNTSSIRLEDLRSELTEPTRFVGLHFFNPVAQLPLVEVIRCEDTEQAALDKAFGFVRQIGKLALECRSSPGFVVNRILGPYMAEAMLMAESGVSLAAIDRAAEDFGMPMGPIELIDSVGLDVALHVSKVLGDAYGREIPGILSELVNQGRLGRKSGYGFYSWKDGKAIKDSDAGSDVPANIADRLMLPMVNEAVACLSEGVVGEADLLDAGVIFGTGFAPFRGGPLQYARDRGVDDILQALGTLAREFSDDGGERFSPHPGWDALRGPKTD
jgi:3-hydroxyacyl-CoA dehydrogenase/enoyl-CoA hydratase/3-hydroxybutyryl-CoA epimerase